MAIRKRTTARRRPSTAAKRRAAIRGTKNGTVRILKFAIPFAFIIAITFGLGFMLLMGYQTATASSFFNVKAIEINGLNRASKDDVENIVRRQVEKTGVWNADLAIIKRDLEELIYVRSAVVSRVLPDGIRISVIERIPRAVVKTDSKEFWVDEDAVVLSKFDQNTEALPFFLKGWDESKTINAAGENKERVRVYRQMLQEWQDFDLVKRVTEVDLRDIEDAKAVVKDSGEFVVITLGKDNFSNGLRNALKAIANKGAEIKSFNVQNSVSQQREKSK